MQKHILWRLKINWESDIWLVLSVNMKCWPEIFGMSSFCGRKLAVLTI